MKTIEEAAKEYVQLRPYSTLETPKLKDESYDGFKAGIEFAQRWIPVEKELPTLKKEIYPILCKYGNNDVEVFYIGNDDDIDDCGKCFTHWRPIELK